MSEHTEGPWEYDLSRDTHDCVIYQKGAENSDHCDKHGYISIDNGGVVGSSEWIWIREEDARLITATPELYEACKLEQRVEKEWNKYVDRDEDSMDVDDLCALSGKAAVLRDRAIAKVEGEEEGAKNG